MPFEYQRSVARLFAVITVVGRYQPSDLMAAFERHSEVGDLTAGLLWDVRRMVGAPTQEDLLLFRSRYVVPGSTERGPVAIVATDPESYRAGCAYLALASPFLAISVFRYLDEAAAWLDNEVASRRFNQQ